MRVQENKCQISQNDALHMKFSKFYLCFHNSCEIWHKRMRYCLNHSGTRFLSPGIEITQFPDGFRSRSSNCWWVPVMCAFRICGNESQPEHIVEKAGYATGPTFSLVPRPVGAIRVSRGGLEPSAIARGVLADFPRQAWQVTSHAKSPRRTGNEAVQL